MRDIPTRRRNAPARLAPGTAAVALTLLTTACSSSSEQPLGGDGSATGPLIVNQAGGVSTIDLAQACNGQDVSFTGQLYARLTQYGTKPGPEAPKSLIRAGSSRGWPSPG